MATLSSYSEAGDSSVFAYERDFLGRRGRGLGANTP